MNTNWKNMLASLIICAMVIALFPLPALAEEEPKPDLIATDILWEPETPYAGDLVLVSAVLKNIGTAATPPGVVSAPVFYADGHFVGYTDTYALSIGPGESVTIPIGTVAGADVPRWVASPGEHIWSVIVDDVNRIQESNESNNQFTKTVKMNVQEKNGPDLVITDVSWTPEQLKAGSPVKLTANITNRGNEPTPEGVPHRVSFALDGETAYWSDERQAPISPGETITLTANAGSGGVSEWLPKPGTSQITATVDDTGLIAEIREDNNGYGIEAELGVPTSEQAKQADAFVESVGFTVHINYIAGTKEYTDIVKPLLVDSGVRYIRDGGTSQAFFDAMNDLALNHGIKSTLVFWPPDLNPDAAVDKGILPIIDSITAIEGPNEWDNNPNAVYNGKKFPEGLVEYQNELFNAIKTHPDERVRNITVLAPSIAYGVNSHKVGPISADMGNLHSYQGGNKPTAGLDGWLEDMKAMVGDKPSVATETGWHYQSSCAGQPGVSEEAGAKYSTRLYLDYFNAGVYRTHLYNLQLDSSCWGLIKQDGTPYQAYDAIKNLVGLLSDKGESFVPGTLNYTLSGSTKELKKLLVQKRDGKFYLILWTDAKSYNLVTRQDIAVPEQKVTLTLHDSIQNANLYRPVQSVRPTHRYPNPGTLVIDVPDEPVVIELTPGEHVEQLPMPDLKITEVKALPEHPNAGEEVKLSATVKNIGEGATEEPLRVSFTSRDSVLTAESSAGIAPGESIKVTTETSWRAIAGQHQFKAIVDAEDKVLESIEINNSVALNIDVNGPGVPDLIVTDISWIPENVQTWDDVEFIAKVKNVGTGLSPEGTVHRVAFMVNDELVSWSGAFDSAIAPGETIELRADGGPGWLAGSGEYTVRANVDDLEQIVEIDDDNNSFAKSMHVEGIGTTPGPLPNEWQSVDIGAASIGGKAGYTEDGIFMVKASGSDIWDTNDGFRYVYQVLSGDGEITARVSGLTDTDPWAKAGVMIRETMDANSKHVSALVTSQNGTNSTGRIAAGEGSYFASGSSNEAPRWVRLVRRGQVITSYESEDGVEWQQIDAKTVPMKEEVFIGLALTSHNNRMLTTGRFDHVVIGTNHSAPVGGISIKDDAEFTRTQEVTLELNAVDDSKVAGMQFSEDGKAWTEWEPYVTVKRYVLSEGDGSKTIYARFRDDAGLVSKEATIGIILDSTAPVITVTGNHGTYTIDQRIQIHCATDDTASGIAASTCPRIDDYGYAFEPGKVTLDATATDKAGNKASAEIAFQIAVTWESMENLIAMWVAEEGLKQSFLSQLEQAKKGAAKNSGAAEGAHMNSFIRHVSAQSGKALTKEQAERLVLFAQSLD